MSDPTALAPPPVPKTALRRLKKRPEFLFVRGGLKAGRGAVLIEARRRTPPQTTKNTDIGLGFTASKKVGNAVARNRARRRLREAARKFLPTLGVAGADYVFVARASAADTPWARLLDDVQNALLRLRADLESNSQPRSGGPAKRDHGRARRGPDAKSPAPRDAQKSNEGD